MLTKFSLNTQAENDLKFWKKTNPKIVKKINVLVKATMHDPFNGIGKPEPLKHLLSGYWSRRITPKDRMVYKVNGDTLEIVQLRHHY